MEKKLGAEVWEQRIRDAGAGRYEFVRWAVDDKFGSSHKCVVRCVIDEFEWGAKVSNLVSKGNGCPLCYRNIRRTAEERIEQINKLENIDFISWVDGYKNVFSKANVKCEIDGFEWSPTVNDIVNKGSGCPQCVGNRRLTADERIEQINSLDNINFISWVDLYINRKSKANVKCKIDGFEWSATVNGLVNGGYGCKQCSGRRRWTSEERIGQINKLENIEFVSWVDSYKGANSKANVRCEVDGFEWSATTHKLVNIGVGCPQCAKYGYDKSKTGTLYALRSECGQYVKVGVSNRPVHRHKDLERATPFIFSCVEQISGDGAKIAELEKHFHSKYERAGFTGFDGATEWLICTPELLEELRNLGDKL